MVGRIWIMRGRFLGYCGGGDGWMDGWRGMEEGGILIG